jgi:hypothetical protein
MHQTDNKKAYMMAAGCCSKKKKKKKRKKEKSRVTDMIPPTLGLLHQNPVYSH